MVSDGVEIPDATAAELVQPQLLGRKLVTYAVRPVFLLNGVKVEGAEATAVVDHTKYGLMILLK